MPIAAYKPKSRSVDFQRRHFEFIAEVIRDMNSPHMEGAQRATANRFASALASTNPNFDRAKFLAACGVVDG